MSIDDLRDIGKNWESLAKHDPMWSILSVPDKRGNKWDINDFLATGGNEINDLMRYIENVINVKVKRSFALDFGCGIGRLSLALAKYFDNVVGVDISSTMITRARQISEQYKDAYKGEITYIINKYNIIPMETDTCDFIYSNIVLQHMRAVDALVYISEFVRMIKKEGLAVFQSPSRSLVAEDKSFKSCIETGGGTDTIEMNMIPIKSVIDTVYYAGGNIINIKRDYNAGPKFESFTYFVSK